MRIALLCDVYHPVVNGVVHHVALLKRYLEQLGQSVWLFVPGESGQSNDFSVPSPDEQYLVRYPGIPSGWDRLSLGPTAQSTGSPGTGLDGRDPRPPSVCQRLAGSDRSQTPQHSPGLHQPHTLRSLRPPICRSLSALLPQSAVESALQSYFRRFSSRCAAQIAPSPGVVDCMRGWGVDGPIRVIPNGIEPDRFTAQTRSVTRQALGLPEHAVVGVFVGRVSAEKRVTYLLKAFATVADTQPMAHLLIVGDGPQSAECRRLAGELGVANRVTFAGEVDYGSNPGLPGHGRLFRVGQRFRGASALVHGGGRGRVAVDRHSLAGRLRYCPPSPLRSAGRQRQ